MNLKIRSKNHLSLNLINTQVYQYADINNRANNLASLSLTRRLEQVKIIAGTFWGDLIFICKILLDCPIFDKLFLVKVDLMVKMIYLLSILNKSETTAQTLRIKTQRVFAPNY